MYHLVYLGEISLISPRSRRDLLEISASIQISPRSGRDLVNLGEISVKFLHRWIYHLHNAFKLPITETHNNILFSIAIDPAKIIKYQNSTVPVGGNTALVCLAEGYPSPNTTWIRDNSREIVGFGSTLQFCSAQGSDTGSYTCSSTNTVGFTDNAKVFLKVTGKS